MQKKCKKCVDIVAHIIHFDVHLVYQQKQSKKMSPKELNKLKESLRKQSGAKYEIAVALGVDPSKITKALDGLVKSEDFMSRLQAKAQEVLKTRKAVSVH